ncbi:hypothetical protein [Magnetovibrio sp.]|uniref:hypothetical protein n=1 Tax=Magnetovibrio sp. TaxID=2024836 RepID=UPI002F95CB67
MHDPGMVYIFGFAAMLAGVAITLYFAKRSLDKRDEEINKLTMKPVYACGAASAAMVMSALVKVTVFADFYNAYSIYTPTA